ncbi:hypothetical protein [[Limnothrix rosea] IAM M-220]|uniref:hypothetical protein n=1 Tax=[Limnothrix rosea] IAM M-220 TaxID=454133 RepID=UPI000961C06A|nr:hypothetical protein [[Limnothrix rosea] IAM M-220]OKH18956.1 hypothetical protein NIES208_03890 [[Limnothrix rosea] IAM M-220]
MNKLFFEHPILPLGALHCAIGLLAALVAYRKGYPLKRWLVIGLVGGTPSLIYAWTRPNLETDQS